MLNQIKKIIIWCYRFYLKTENTRIKGSVVSTFIGIIISAISIILAIQTWCLFKEYKKMHNKIIEKTKMSLKKTEEKINKFIDDSDEDE